MEKQIEEMVEIIQSVKDYIYFGEIRVCEYGVRDGHAEEIAEALYNADYRKQSKNVVELSCKVGDLVYETYGNRIFEYVITSIELTSPYDILYKWQATERWNRYVRNIGFTKSNIGKTVFLTREEAIAKMKGGE